MDMHVYYSILLRRILTVTADSLCQHCYVKYLCCFIWLLTGFSHIFICQPCLGHYTSFLYYELYPVLEWWARCKVYNSETAYCTVYTVYSNQLQSASHRRLRMKIHLGGGGNFWGHGYIVYIEIKEGNFFLKNPPV